MNLVQYLRRRFLHLFFFSLPLCFRGRGVTYWCAFRRNTLKSCFSPSALCNKQVPHFITVVRLLCLFSSWIASDMQQLPKWCCLTLGVILTFLPFLFGTSFKVSLDSYWHTHCLVLVYLRGHSSRLLLVVTSVVIHVMHTHSRVLSQTNTHTVFIRQCCVSAELLPASFHSPLQK